MIQISVVRGSLNKSERGVPLPAVRIEEAGKPERHVHEVHILGPSKIGPYQAGRIVVETDSAVEEITWDVKPEG